MGIQGLWQVLEPTGRPVTIHSLRGKILAVDVSIWLHQLVKGFRDRDGNPLPNAHLLGVFHRVCKLLNYGVKPVFVFDGGVPVLKRQTLASRRQKKLESLDKAELSRQKILSAYLQQQLQRHAKRALPPSLRMQARIAELSSNNGGKKSPSVSPKKRGLVGNDSKDKNDEVHEDLESFRAALVAKLEDDMDEVDPKYKKTTSDSDDDDDDSMGQYRYGVDYSENFSVIQKPEFDTLPLETQHEILFEMQESRKMNSWGKFDKMPKDLPSFSSFQMDRLVKRRALQKKIQSVQQEMGQRHIHVQNLDDLLKMDYNFDSKEKTVMGSKEDGFVLIKSQEPKKVEKEKEPKPGTSSSSSRTNNPEIITIDDFVEDSSDEDGEGMRSAEPKTHSTTQVSEEAKEKELIKPYEKKKHQHAQFEEDEEEDLKLAIQLSLMEAEAMKKEEELKLSEIPTDLSTEEQSQDISNSALHVQTNKSTFSQSEIQSVAGAETNEKETSTPAPSKRTTFLESIHSEPNMSHCAKFLDTIGFHIPPTSDSISTTVIQSEKEKVSSELKHVQTEIVQESESESDQDFEEVESQSHDDDAVSSPLSLLTPEGSTMKRDENVDVEMGRTETVAVIDLSSIQNAPLKKEDDIFADIFSNTGEDEDETKKFDIAITQGNKSARKSFNLAESRDESTNIPVEVDDTTNSTNSSKWPDQEEALPIQQPTDDTKWDSDDEIEADLMEMVLAESISLEKQENPKKSSREKNLSTQNESKAEKMDVEGAQTMDSIPLNTEKDEAPKRIITAEYMQAQEQLNSKLERLHSTKGQQERVATSISDQMQIETQELISLFGIPYVVSPTEAESQCAFLDRACLTEGSITDDSDVWLFGGQRVYKNFFSQGQKHVEFYQAADIQRVLNLSREKLIALAMLIGSDYSDGIQGVGPVLGLEILSEFTSREVDSFESLVKFRDWWEQIQTKNSDVYAGSKLKEKLRKLNIRPGFPNSAVYEAFMNPAIDTSTEPFKWGNPDLDAIRSYVKQKFGWEQSKCDSLLLPVLKNLRCEVEQSRQLTLDSYISIGKMPTLDYGVGGKRKKGSKRIENAVKKLKSVSDHSHELNLSSESDSEEETLKKNVSQKVQLTNRKLKLGKRATAQKGKRKESQPGTSSSSSKNVGNSKILPISTAPKPEVIPQRVQAESDKKKSKQKAIEIFKMRKETKK